MIEINTKNDLCLSVVSRWNQQYAKTDQPNQQEITKKLNALTTEQSTAENINTIIGNTSWTSFGCCDACGEDILDVQITIGQTPDYESSTARVCIPCIKTALAIALEFKRRL